MQDSSIGQHYGPAPYTTQDSSEDVHEISLTYAVSIVKWFFGIFV